MFSKHLDEKHIDNIVEMFKCFENIWKIMSLENNFRNMNLKHLQCFGNVAQTFHQMFCKPFIPPLQNVMNMFTGWITFTKRRGGGLAFGAQIFASLFHPLAKTQL